MLRTPKQTVLAGFQDAKDDRPLGPGKASWAGISATHRRCGATLQPVLAPKPMPKMSLEDHAQTLVDMIESVLYSCGALGYVFGVSDGKLVLHIDDSNGAGDDAPTVLPTDGHSASDVAEACNQLIAARPDANFLQRARFR